MLLLLLPPVHSYSRAGYSETRTRSSRPGTTWSSHFFCWEGWDFLKKPRARRGPEIDRDCARSTEIVRRGPRRGGWVGIEGAEVASAVEGQLGAREPDL